MRQRTAWSETTKDKAGALPPAVYYTQPPHSKVMFHDDSTVEGREGMEQIMPQVTDDDGDSQVPSIMFVDDSTVEIVAAGEVPDQEDEYDTDSPGLVAPFQGRSQYEANRGTCLSHFFLSFLNKA